MAGWAVEPARAVREHFGGDLLPPGGYQRRFQPGRRAAAGPIGRVRAAADRAAAADEDQRRHAVCLDESIVSAKTAADALAIGACRVINVKPGQVGGYLQAKRIHDLAGRTRSPWGDAGDRVGPSCESALAGLAGFRLSGEISASDRFYTTDITKPFILSTDTSACLQARLGSPRSPGSADSGLHPKGCWCPMEGRCITMALL